MAENKLTPEEIKKALECCKPSNEDGCLNCPLSDVHVKECTDILLSESIDLINRQQAEIERLQTENNKLNDDIKVYQRLQRDRDIVSYDDFKKSIIDEYIDKLLKVRGIITLSTINEIRKEMVGEQG